MLPYLSVSLSLHSGLPSQSLPHGELVGQVCYASAWCVVCAPTKSRFAPTVPLTTHYKWINQLAYVTTTTTCVEHRLIDIGPSATVILGEVRCETQLCSFQNEERLAMLAQKSALERERAELRAERQAVTKNEQQTILNKGGQARAPIKFKFGGK